MILETVITSVLTSSLISSLIGFIVYIRQKKVDFSYNYRSYILDKRKEIYNKVEGIISKLTTKFQVHLLLEEHRGIERLQIHIFAGKGNGDFLAIFNDEIIGCINGAIWLSDEMYLELNKLNTAVVKIIHAANDNRRLEMQRQIAVARNFDEIELITGNLVKIYFKDICNLDNIKKFKNKIHLY